MIDRAMLLAELQPLVRSLQDDIRNHADKTPEIAAHLRVEHQRSVSAERTAMALEEWREGEITQAAVAWVLACVFVRFLEDNALIDQALLSGPGERRRAALGRREVYFSQHPQESDREFLLWVFDHVARFPVVAPLYDERHTPFRRLPLSVDGARMLREFWVQLDPDSGVLVRDFHDSELGTRFLGDLYQDLSEEAKKRYALLQTPEFVEEFILDRTLEPAIDEFGLDVVRLIDPTCGSGHFLIGAFDRLVERWRDREPGTEIAVLAQRALDAIYGVDLNPYATAIARFRVVLAALRACGIRRLAEAPAFRLNLATGDSLLHGPERGQFEGFGKYRAGISHVYETEDAAELARMFGQGYHAVVGNPPYINVADSALRDVYRARYESCHGKYALSVPFMERFFELARPEFGDRGVAAGYVGKITANSFMKREFGAPLVERFLTTVDLTALIDTNGAYIPGHGTPTVIVFGRSREPRTATLRALDAIRGEPSQPANPAQGEVWRSIVELVDRPGEENRYIRASDVDRSEFATHPMTLGVGRDLRRSLERGSARLGSLSESLGFASFTGMDDGFVIDRGTAVRLGVPADIARDFIVGDALRDWLADPAEVAITPYDAQGSHLPLDPGSTWARLLWPNRTVSLAVTSFGGKTRRELGDSWWTWYRWVAAKYRTLLSITWGEVATHNHFVLDRGGKVFKQTAPVIKLPGSATEDDHLRLLGVLNSASACFWLKQVCQPKGGDYVGQEGARVSKSPWEDRFALNASNMQDLPLPTDLPLDLPKRLDSLAGERAALVEELPQIDLRAGVAELAARDAEILAQQISLQEELDWQVMAAYGLVRDHLPVAGRDAPPIALGERAFEIVLARQVARGETETTWFSRHRSTPITQLRAHWPADYRELVERRIELIENDPDVGLIERPEHKRRWSGQKPFAERLHEALRNLVLDRLEELELWAEPQLRSVSELADVVRRDARLVEACQLIAGSPDADAGAVVRLLVLDEAVPFLAALRHTEPGMRRRGVWERVWDSQRKEDAIDALTELPEDGPRHITKERAEARKRAEVGRIPVPPRYTKNDFRPGPTWALRGKLDVPKERFVLVPGAERGEAGSPTVGWAGWDERHRARALAGRIIELQGEAADRERLTPLLAGVLELVPWIHQWHPDPDPAYGGTPAGAFFDEWLDGKLAELGLTREALRAWRPAAKPRGRRQVAATAPA